MKDAVRILVDQDGVLADWGAGFDRMFAERYPYLAFTPHEERTVWAAAGNDREVIAATREIMNTPGFFLNLDPVPGAAESLNEMVEGGYDVSICTAPWPSNPTCASEKLDWIGRHFGNEWVGRTVIAMDKTLIRGDYLFDDRDKVAGTLEPTWTHVRVSQPYNLGLPGPRVASIRDWRAGVSQALLNVKQSAGLAPRPRRKSNTE